MRTLPDSWSWGTYLRWSLAAVVTTIAAVGLFNVFMDALGAFDSPRIAGVNATKPYLEHHRELSRFRLAERVCAPTGIFGNSRAEIGFDPESPELIGRGHPAFNHAIPGSSVANSLRQLLWLQQVKCLPRTVFLGVEFFDSLGGYAALPLPTITTHPVPRLDARFFAETVFSITGLRDSLITLALQHERYPASLTARGFNPLRNYVPEVAQSGHYALFRQRAQENLRNWSRKAPRISPAQGGRSEDEVYVEAILQRMSAAGGTTYVVIYPYHSQIRLMLERMGLGQLFAQWKRQVVDIAQRAASAGGQVQVWDFSGVSPQTMEAIPAKGDRRTQLNFYWEAGHFKKALGDRLLARMLGESGDFGVRLNGANIETWLEEDRRRVQDLLKSGAPVAREVEDLFVHAQMR